jgi:hypothetical protein
LLQGGELFEETKIKNRISAKKIQKKRDEKQSLLQAEYDWHTVIETDAAIDCRCLEMGMEELMRAMAQKEVQNQENLKKKHCCIFHLFHALQTWKRNKKHNNNNNKLSKFTK